MNLKVVDEMAYSPDLIKLGYVEREQKVFSEELVDSLFASYSETLKADFRKAFDEIGEVFVPKNFEKIPNAFAITGYLDLLDMGFCPEDVGYFLESAKVPGYSPLLSLIALTRSHQLAEGQPRLPTWLRSLEESSVAWGLIANVFVICAKIGESPSFFLNPVLNLNLKGSRTFESSFKEVHSPKSFDGYRDYLVDKTWSHVGYRSKDEAVKAIGIKYV